MDNKMYYWLYFCLEHNQINLLEKQKKDIKKLLKWINEDKNHKSSAIGVHSLNGDRKKKQKQIILLAAMIYLCEYIIIKIS